MSNNQKCKYETLRDDILEDIETVNAELYTNIIEIARLKKLILEEEIYGEE